MWWSCTCKYLRRCLECLCCAYSKPPWLPKRPLATWLKIPAHLAHLGQKSLVVRSTLFDHIKFRTEVSFWIEVKRQTPKRNSSCSQLNSFDSVVMIQPLLLSSAHHFSPLCLGFVFHPLYLSVFLPTFIIHFLLLLFHLCFYFSTS